MKDLIDELSLRVVANDSAYKFRIYFYIVKHLVLNNRSLTGKVELNKWITAK